MRKGFDGLHGIVRDRLGLEVRTGHLFLFANARRNRLKILYWDGYATLVIMGPRDGEASGSAAPVDSMAQREVSYQRASRKAMMLDRVRFGVRRQGVGCSCERI